MRVKVRILAPMLLRRPLWLWTVAVGRKQITWGLAETRAEAANEAKLARQAAERLSGQGPTETPTLARW